MDMIPTPKSLLREPGVFGLANAVTIHCEENGAKVVLLAERLRRHLRQRTGLDAPVSTAMDCAPGSILLRPSHEPDHGPEDYALSVTENLITITGREAGLLYGVEALCQLIERQDDEWVWPCMQIHDGPAFQWRGVMLDCSRHFLSKAFLLRFIDLLPSMRMNRLHLHLNDDQGWRIHISAYPKLTHIGASIETGPNQRGFYTHQDLREIVEFAGDRNILVVPEIEIPGHAFACMKSYPILCCTGKPIRNPGHQKDLYCAGKESTFEFLQTVLSEIMALFPSPFIHIGGDEAPKDRWRQCPACKERMDKEGLQDEEELQGYMIGRCADFLRSHGRQVIGWDEILDGNPASDTIVQWWRHRDQDDQALRTALARGHRAIASPNSFCYLSFPVVPDEHFTPARTSDLRKVYGADLVPKDLPPDQRTRILGVECCIWTEYLNEEDILTMLFPRVLAAIELMWSDPDKRNYKAFLSRVLDAEAYWRSAGVPYGPYTGKETIPDKHDTRDGC